MLVHRRATDRLRLFGHRPDPVRLAPHDRHLGAAAGKLDCGGFADPARGSCYDYQRHGADSNRRRLEDDQAVLTQRVLDRIDEEFSGPDRAQARDMVARMSSELSMWREVSEGDRVERAALTFAGGDLDRLRTAVDLALVDWRDLLVAVGDA